MKDNLDAPKILKSLLECPVDESFIAEVPVGLAANAATLIEEQIGKISALEAQVAQLENKVKELEQASPESFKDSLI